MGFKEFVKARPLRARQNSSTNAAELTLRQSIFPIVLVTILFFLWGFSYGTVKAPFFPAPFPLGAADATDAASRKQVCSTPLTSTSRRCSTSTARVPPVSRQLTSGMLPQFTPSPTFTPQSKGLRVPPVCVTTWASYPNARLIKM